MFCRLACFAMLFGAALTASAAQGITSENLGKLQSTLDYCARHNPRAAVEYRDQAKEKLHGADSSTVAHLRTAPIYRKAYNDTRDELQKNAKEDAAATCERMMFAIP